MEFRATLSATLLLAASVPLATPAGIAAQQAEPAPGTEEIIVNAPENLRRFRVEIDRAQVNLFNVFNELNDDDMFDVNCRYVRRWQSKIRQQVCTPVYWDIAKEEEANRVLGLLGVVGVERGLPGDTRIPHYNDIFREKVETVLNEHPEFRQALEEYEALQETFNEIRKARFNLED